jgi:hypothetical protein
VTRIEASIVSFLLQAALLALAAWRLGAFGGADRGRRAAERFARRCGLPAVTPDLVRRVVRRQRFVMTGVATGMFVGWAVELWGPRGTFVDYAWFGLVYAGLAFGALAGRLAELPTRPGQPRVAHATAIRLDDYVPRELPVAGVAGVAAVVALAAWWVAAPRSAALAAAAGGDQVTGGAVVAVVVAAVAALAGSLSLARIVVRRRQAATTPEGLAIDDAQRAQAVRDVLHLTAAVTVLSVSVIATGLTDQGVQGPARHVGGILPLAALVLLGLLGTWHEFTGGPRRWRQRLRPPAPPATAVVE